MSTLFYPAIWRNLYNIYRKDFNIKNGGETFFGGSTFASVLLKPGQFQGMTSNKALALDRSTTVWKTAEDVALNYSSYTNTIGQNLYFADKADFLNRKKADPSNPGREVCAGNANLLPSTYVYTTNTAFFQTEPVSKLLI